MVVHPGVPDPTAPLPARVHRLLTDLFDHHVEHAPERLAVADPVRSWSYLELQSRAHQLAHWLMAKGIRKNDIVAIHAERSALTVLAMLAVLKADAAFMLLDSEYPADRILSHVRVARPTAWIDTSSASVAAFATAQGMPAHRISLADNEEQLRDLPTTRPAVEVLPDQLAYVVFTSGTTGTPKAAVASMAALAHFLEWQTATFGLTKDDRFSALSGVAHLPFTRDVFTPLSVGASIHIPSQELRLEPDQLAAWLAKSRVSVAHCTPSLAEVLTIASSDSTVPDLRILFFAGEPLRGELLERLRRIVLRTAFVNLYGASETAQSISYFAVEPPVSGVLPIGRGIADVQLLVVKDDETLAAVSEEGEIWVRTPYLASTYLRGETGGYATNPFTGDATDRIYRTGDRGRYRADGSVEVLGRRDDQVKVRGFRVELREVETAIMAHPGVTRAVVILSEELRALVAYVVGDVETVAVLAALRKLLPDYMVPATIMLMAQMPLTANGKLDRASLPPPQSTGTRAVGDSLANDVERSLAGIFVDILECENVARHDNFFDLGGHSLNANRVAAHIRTTFHVDITVRMIFDAPTVAELAVRVSQLLAMTATV